jgi:two-component system, NtrC family, sensor kinase
MSENAAASACLYVLPAAVGSLVFSALVIVSLVREGRGTAVNRLFAAICFLGALINADVVVVALVDDDELALKIDRLVYLLFIFSIPVYIRFTHVYFGISRRLLEAATLGASAFMLLFTQHAVFIRGHHEYSFGRIAQAGPLYCLFITFAGAAVVYCMALMVSHLVAATDNRRKNRLKYLIVGFGMGAALIALNALPVMGIPVYPPGNFSFIPAVVLAFGVLKYDLLDLRAAAGKWFFYLFFTGSLAIVYLLILYILNLAAMSLGTQNPLVISLFLALPVVLIFEPLKKAIRALVERFYFRGRYNYRHVLKDVSHTLTSLLKLEDVGRYLVDSVCDALNLSSVFLVVFDDENGDVAMTKYRGARAAEDVDRFKEVAAPAVRLFEEEGRFVSAADIERSAIPANMKENIGAFVKRFDFVFVFPLYFKNRLSALLMLGDKTSGDLFTPEDLELLTTISNQAAVAIANAASYERLANVNRDLEKRVEERTAGLVKAMEEREHTRQQLIRSESLAAIGQLVAGTAHELNNPLAGALSLVESSMETLSENQRDDKYLDEVMEDLAFSVKELKRAGGIIKSLLSLSRQTHETDEPVDINAVLEDALRILRIRYKNRDIAITKELAPDPPVLRGNTAQLGQAFINIINNAIQALPDSGGSITLTSRFVEEKNSLLVHCRDDGCGIHSDCLQEIFHPFYTTKQAGEGTGLGLYISHEIIRKHEGTIHIESEWERGTTVIVELPLERSKQ